MTYDILRKKFADDSGGLTLWRSAVAGVSAGGLAQFLASPADLVKVHIQMEGKRRLMGLAPRVHSASHAFKEIVKRGGMVALWKGSVPNVQRAALVNLGDLTTYDSVKRYILRTTGLPDDHVVHIASSICAGFVAAGLGTPADVIKTRIMNQPTDKEGRSVDMSLLRVSFLILNVSEDFCTKDPSTASAKQSTKKGFVHSTKVSSKILKFLIKDSQYSSFRISPMLDPNGALVAYILAELRANPKVTRCRRVLIASNRSTRVHLVVGILNA